MIRSSRLHIFSSSLHRNRLLSRSHRTSLIYQSACLRSFVHTLQRYRLPYHHTKSSLTHLSSPATIMMFPRNIVWLLASLTFTSNAFVPFASSSQSFRKLQNIEQISNNNQCINTQLKSATIEETATESKTQILAEDDAFIKPNLDTRLYRSILLPNNLQCLLVSDAETDVEAAAVHIKAGHFDDPADRAGLAHFNEHMLFLGTEKYPKENDFETFVGKNGGGTNAYTDM